MGLLQVLPLLGKNGPGIDGNEGSTRAPELKPHHWMQFSAIPKTSIFLESSKRFILRKIISDNLLKELMIYQKYACLAKKKYLSVNRISHPKPLNI